MTSVQLDAPRVTEPGDAADFAELVRRVKSAGLLDKQPKRYLAKSIAVFGFMAVGWVAFFLIGNSWWQLLTAVYMAIAFGQVGFLGHDAGHRQAFRSKRSNMTLMYLCGNLGTGVSSGYWFGKHYRHHAHPNNIDLDPDVQVKSFAYTKEQVGQKRGINRLIVRCQHLLYFPLTSLEGFSLHIFSVVALIKDRSICRRRLEAVLLAINFVAYGVAVFSTLSLGRAIAFVFVHQMLYGLYLGATFAPNHKGMAMFEEEPPYLRHQVLTSRNVSGGPVVTFLFGGLNHQIEHHIFPAMPRRNLARVRPIVKSFCEEIGLEYQETTVRSSYRSIVGYFAETSRG